MTENNEWHASERSSSGRERPTLKRKLAGKAEQAKTKGNKREKREIEEEFKAVQVINKLASVSENKSECEIFGELIAAELKIL